MFIKFSALSGDEQGTLETFSTTVTKINQSMTYKAKVALCAEIRTKYPTQSIHHVKLFNVKPSGT
jgi:hypothetical protein